MSIWTVCFSQGWELLISLFLEATNRSAMCHFSSRDTWSCLYRTSNKVESLQWWKAMCVKPGKDSCCRELRGEQRGLGLAGLKFMLPTVQPFPSSMLFSLPAHLSFHFYSSNKIKHKSQHFLNALQDFNPCHWWKTLWKHAWVLLPVLLYSMYLQCAQSQANLGLLKILEDED